MMSRNDLGAFPAESPTSAAESPLLKMVRETPTDYWNDSCAVSELAYAIERGVRALPRTRASSSRC